MQKQFFNPFEFLTTPWGSLPLNSGSAAGGMMNPADLNEMEKRINELKAVEQWLSLNLNLLKTTIQGLEVQRGTLAAIAAFNESITKAPDSAKKKPLKIDPVALSAAQGQATDQAAFWWDSMQKQFEQMMTAAQASAQSMVEPKTKSAKKEKSDEKSSDSSSLRDTP